mmetsp:Transcript_28930/g.49311  ORF Transcript_28930/g.49311 Transcript_28930/m.49311 type:complete len:303 (-) Transcript_28930:500-1408(-)
MREARYKSVQRRVSPGHRRGRCRQGGMDRAMIVPFRGRFLRKQRAAGGSERGSTGRRQRQHGPAATDTAVVATIATDTAAAAPSVLSPPPPGARSVVLHPRGQPSQATGDGRRRRASPLAGALAEAGDGATVGGERDVGADASISPADVAGELDHRHDGCGRRRRCLRSIWPERFVPSRQGRRRRAVLHIHAHDEGTERMAAEPSSGAQRGRIDGLGILCGEQPREQRQVHPIIPMMIAIIAAATASSSSFRGGGGSHPDERQPVLLHESHAAGIDQSLCGICILLPVRRFLRVDVPPVTQR